MTFRLQLVCFADLASFAPTPELTIRVMQGFRDAGIEVMPTLAQELQTNGTFQPRLRLVAPSSAEIEIGVLSGRVDIARASTDPAVALNVGRTEFVHFAQRVLDILFAGQERSAQRLAIVTQKFHDDAQSQGMFERYVNAPTLFEEAVSVDWGVRFNVRGDLQFAERIEPSNRIFKLERVAGQVLDGSGRVQSFNRLIREIDINTIPENMAARFPFQEVGAFAVAAFEAEAAMLAALGEDL